MERTPKLVIVFALMLLFIIGIWVFAIEPIIHYHSLSVVCSARFASACEQLKGY